MADRNSFTKRCRKSSRPRRGGANGNFTYRIEVDGGINFQTVAECARAGADTFVAGTSLFGAHNLRAAVKKMRQIANAHDPALADLKV